MPKSELDRKTKQYAFGSIFFLIIGLCTIVATLFGLINAIYIFVALLLLGFVAGICFGVLLCRSAILDYERRLNEE
jgi:hypothetical protein